MEKGSVILERVWQYFVDLDIMKFSVSTRRLDPGLSSFKPNIPHQQSRSYMTFVL